MHVNACVFCDEDCAPHIPSCQGDYGAALDELLVAEEALALCDPQLTAAVDNVPLLLIDLVGAGWGVRVGACGLLTSRVLGVSPHSLGGGWASVCTPAARKRPRQLRAFQLSRITRTWLLLCPSTAQVRSHPPTRPPCPCPASCSPPPPGVVLLQVGRHAAAGCEPRAPQAGEGGPGSGTRPQPGAAAGADGQRLHAGAGHVGGVVGEREAGDGVTCRREAGLTGAVVTSELVACMALWGVLSGNRRTTVCVRTPTLVRLAFPGAHPRASQAFLYLRLRTSAPQHLGILLTPCRCGAIPLIFHPGVHTCHAVEPGVALSPPPPTQIPAAGGAGGPGRLPRRGATCHGGGVPAGGAGQVAAAAGAWRVLGQGVYLRSVQRVATEAGRGGESKGRVVVARALLALLLESA